MRTDTCKSSLQDTLEILAFFSVSSSALTEKLESNKAHWGHGNEVLAFLAMLNISQINEIIQLAMYPRTE